MLYKMMMKKHILFFWGCVCLSLSLTAQTTTADAICLTLSMDTITLDPLSVPE